MICEQALPAAMNANRFGEPLILFGTMTWQHVVLVHLGLRLMI